LAAGLKTQHLHGNHRLAVQQHDAVHGPDELRGAITPAHAFRNRQCGDGLSDDAPQQAGRRCAPLRAAKHQPLALVAFELREFGHRHTAILGECDGGLSGDPLCVECDLERRAALLHLLVGLMLCQGLYPHGEAPRRSEALHLAVRNSGGIQSGEHTLGEGRR
jgi:hypothetical protein